MGSGNAWEATATWITKYYKYFGPFWNARFFQDAQKLETIQKSLDKAGQWHLFGDCQLVWKARIKPAETDDIR